MSLTATYVDANAKVTLTVASAPANAATVLFERSINGGVTWSTVRGAQAVALTSGAAAFDDYEFSDRVVNTYRATYTDTSTPAYVGTAAAASVTTSAGASASVTPSMPTGLAVGEVVFVALACTKSTGAAPAAPTGWTALAGDTPDSMALYAADWTASLTMPAFTMTGLASGDKLVAKAFAIRNVAPTAANVQAAVNTAATSIAYPAFTASGGWNVGPLVAFIRSINTGVTPAAGTNDTATGWSLLTYLKNPATYVAGSITVAGGSSATSGVLQANMAVRTLVSQETGTVTPALSTSWIKDPLAPFLNRAVVPITIGTVTNAARTGINQVIGRTTPTAVTDVYGARTGSLTLRMADPTTFQDIHDCQMNGAVKFVHAPKGSRTPTGYFALGDLAETFPSDTGTSRYLGFTITECAAPDPSLAPITGTWQTVINTYATWSALIAAKATWADVLLLVGSPTDVIVT